MHPDGNIFYGDIDDESKHQRVAANRIALEHASIADIYDDQDDAAVDDAPPTLISPSKLHNNATTQGSNPAPANEPEEERSYDDDDEEFDDAIHGNSMSVHRVESKNPTVVQATTRMPFDPADFWHNLFARPAILVGQSARPLSAVVALASRV